jgi:outer membrane protein assembly factor BamE (lipoprotein component of BamABCDE complex)
MRVRSIAPIVLLAATAFVAGCAPSMRTHGYVPVKESTDAVEPGTDSKQSVLRRLGSPSSLATFDADTWYYISTRERHHMYHRPKVVAREVVAVSFGEDGTVEELNRFTIEDGLVIAYVGKETPTRGKQLGFLEQIFGNLGASGFGSGGSSTLPGRPGSDR